MDGRLVTIPISHYCEKARWALDRAGVDYVEQRHVQVVHIAFARAAGGGRTVPVFVTAAGDVLAESSHILRWADARVTEDRRLYPEEAAAEVAALERRFDDGLGPDGRLWMYHHLLPVAGDLRPWGLAGVPRGERALFAVGGRWMEPVIRRYLGVDERAAAVALQRVDRVFGDVADRLSDGRRFLAGDRFTAADLTFAALAASVLVPDRYGSPLPPVEALPEAAAREIRRLRAHPAGVFAERLYREERPAPPGFRRSSSCPPGPRSRP